jgi:hypothetical protein
MVLKSNQRKSQTRVAAEPELKRNEESSLRDAGSRITIISTFSMSNRLGKTRDVTNHVSITSLMTSSLGQFIPDMEPITVVFINTLTTDFDFNILYENVSEPVKPTETSSIYGTNLGESYLKVNTMN